MFYAMATKKVRSRFLNFRHVLEDIETLNKKAVQGLYELTAISYHAYPYVADKYVLLASGSSVGDGYGPLVVSSRHLQPDELKGKRIAIPGTMTTAFLTMKLFQPDFEQVGFVGARLRKKAGVEIERCGRRLVRGRDFQAIAAPLHRHG